MRGGVEAESRNRRRREVEGTADGRTMGNVHHRLAGRAPAIAVAAEEEEAAENFGSNDIDDSEKMNKEVEAGEDTAVDRTPDPEEEDNDDRNMTRVRQKREEPVERRSRRQVDCWTGCVASRMNIVAASYDLPRNIRDAHPDIGEDSDDPPRAVGRRRRRRCWGRGRNHPTRIPRGKFR